MATIVPRWEWRTFGRVREATDDAFAAAEASPVSESDETYFFTKLDANVKIRDGLLDIKLLRETDANGLERWEPVLKAPFPLSRDDLATVIETMGIDGPADPPAETSLEAFQAIVDADDRATTVPVHKRRVRYTIGGCMAERSEIESNGRTIVTVAVESTDQAGVVAAVESLGLGDYLNTSYMLAMAHLRDGLRGRYAVIDVGTNSVKFIVATFEDGTGKVIVDRAEVTRLGEGLAAGGTIQPAPLERTTDAIIGMVDEAKRLGARAIAAVATEGMRQASNAHEAAMALRARTGVRIDI